ncbi:tripartite tricarboxylate transporter substrate binding protein [Natribacillus halophilus]|uniref:Tripartite-type tricarboxylate transporter, receptor component TctC n=1 Tax=Natribacillus halophilus TaxID=549003 RepID=A0A1G8RDW6_9BACI|nr:tripartite tricarboxylate transporter substrate binding protein [Natribacillus halophilus]SDJ14715.1 Tripartite-type tricarboxylate transporter, receptor component TctC [Natribacillus halophilus]
MKAMKAIGVLLLPLLVACGEGTAGDTEEVDSYPQEPVEINIPASPGGGTDNGARLLSQHLPEYLEEDEDITVINEDGGGGTLAFNNVHTSEQEGHELFYWHQAVHSGYVTDQFESPATELTPITTFDELGQVYVVSADSPWETLEEFVEDASENPGELQFGAEMGGTTHFMAAMLELEADIDLDIQESGDESERMSALLGGQMDMVVTGVGNAIEYVESGDFAALGVLSEEPDELAPDMPTTVEQGYDIEFSAVQTLFGPPDMPDYAVDAVDEAVNEMLEDEDIISQLEDIGHTPAPQSHEETVQMVEEDLEEFEQIANELGITE